MSITLSTPMWPNLLWQLLIASNLNFLCRTSWYSMLSHWDSSVCLYSTPSYSTKWLCCHKSCFISCEYSGPTFIESIIPLCIHWQILPTCESLQCMEIHSPLSIWLVRGSNFMVSKTLILHVYTSIKASGPSTAVLMIAHTMSGWITLSQRILDKESTSTLVFPDLY